MTNEERLLLDLRDGKENEVLLSIIKNLMNGKRYQVGDSGRIIAMGDNYQIGFVMFSLVNGQGFISHDIGISGLHKLLGELNG